MSILFGFAPWIVYWVLVGNVPFLTAVLLALATAIAAYVVGRLSGKPGQTLQIGAVATFAVLTVLTLVLDQDVMERWMQPLSNAGIFLVALVGALTGRSFVREYAEDGQPADVMTSDLFGRIVSRLTWIWVAVFAGMTVSSAVPPIFQGDDATILDTEEPLSIIFYWVIPMALLAVGALASKILPDRMTAGMADAERKTTFVAPIEVAIDELYYLATEHANREAGAGRQAYNVKVGSKGTPLVGDDSRMSWPSTYKVRAR
jgi:hypothetical protein